MSVDLIAIRASVFCVLVFVVCECIPAQSSPVATILENASPTDARVPDRAPQLVGLNSELQIAAGDYIADLVTSGCDATAFLSCGCGGPECAQGCPECVPSRKSKWACRREHRRQSRPPVLGFVVEEVRYGANAGYPSFGVVSHGPWYNGPVKGPGRGKLAELKSKLTAWCCKKRNASGDEGCQCDDCDFSESASSYYSNLEPALMYPGISN